MRLLKSRLNWAILWHFVAIYFLRKYVIGFIYIFIKKLAKLQLLRNVNYITLLINYVLLPNMVILTTYRSVDKSLIFTKR